MDALRLHWTMSLRTRLHRRGGDHLHGGFVLVQIRNRRFKRMVRLDDLTLGTPPEQPRQTQHERCRIELRHLVGRLQDGCPRT